MGKVPNRSCKVNHASIAPVVVTGSHPTGSIWPRAKIPSASNAAGERPDPLKPCKRCVPMQTKGVDPKPLLVGSVTVNAAAVAMAASMLLPPRPTSRGRLGPPTAGWWPPPNLQRRARGGMGKDGQVVGSMDGDSTKGRLAPRGSCGSTHLGGHWPWLDSWAGSWASEARWS